MPCLTHSKGRELAERQPRVLRLIGEFLTIVVGVLVALAVDQARTASDEVALEGSYLTRLADEIRDDRDETTADLIFRWGAMERSAQETLGYLEDPSLPLDDLTGFAVEAIQPAFQASWQPAEGTTFEELLSTGRLNLIRDPAVRTALLSFYRTEEAQAAFVDRMDLGYRLYVQRVGGPAVWWPAMECYDRRSAARVAEPFDCHPEVGTAEVERFVAALRSDSSAGDLLRQRLVDIGTLRTWLQERQERQSRLLESLLEATQSD